MPCSIISSRSSRLPKLRSSRSVMSLSPFCSVFNPSCSSRASSLVRRAGPRPLPVSGPSAPLSAGPASRQRTEMGAGSPGESICPSAMGLSRFILRTSSSPDISDSICRVYMMSTSLFFAKSIALFALLCRDAVTAPWLSARRFASQSSTFWSLSTSSMTIVSFPQSFVWPIITVPAQQKRNKPIT